MSRCSIIIINHNDYENLVKTVKSVRKQEYSDKEIIVVDNNSSDKSKDFLEQQSDLKTINCKKNLGVSKAKNLGVSKCTGKYILFLYSDILFIDKKTIKEVIKIYKKNKPAIISLLTKNKNESKTKLYGVFLNFFYSEINKKIEFKKIQDFKDNYPVSCPHAALMFTERPRAKPYKGIINWSEFYNFCIPISFEL